MELKRVLSKKLRRNKTPEKIELPESKFNSFSTPATPQLPATPASETFVSIPFDDTEKSPFSSPQQLRSGRPMLNSRSRSSTVSSFDKQHAGMTAASSPNLHLSSTTTSPYSGAVSSGEKAPLYRSSSIQRNSSLAKSSSYSRLSRNNSTDMGRSFSQPMSPVSMSDSVLPGWSHENMPSNDDIYGNRRKEFTDLEEDSEHERDFEEDDDAMTDALADEMAQQILDTVREGGHFWAL